MKLLSPLSTVVALSVVATACAPESPSPEPAAQDTAVSAQIQITALDEFGFDLAGWRVTDGTIRWNQTFSDLLADHGIDHLSIHRLVENSDGVFDLRSWRAGKRYRVYASDDAATAPRALVYEHSSVDYIVFDLVEPFNVYRESRPVHVRVRQVKGRIDDSLYESLMRVDVDPTLAVSLSEVFAWQIDFFRIQRGDSFNVVFEERSVGEKKIGIGDVQSAYFRHFDDDYFAFHYPEEGRLAYFDENGESLRKAFLRAPVKFSRISSRYSMSRFHPVLRRRRAHLGTDYAADRGTPIMSTGDGVIAEASYTRGNGNYVKVRHNGTYTTGYLHMSRIKPGIRPGAHVRQGDIIGYVGSTGLATGNHVCYRFWKNGRQVDPLREDFPSVEPLTGETLAEFMTVRDQYMQRLVGTPVHLAP